MAQIQTPCNNVCAIDPAFGLCVGCGRTAAEITGWIGFTPQERTEIMAGLPQRLASMQRSEFTPAGGCSLKD